MRVLVTGTEGYIGARLAPHWRNRRTRCTGLDTGLYRDGCLYIDSAGAAHRSENGLQGPAQGHRRRFRGLRRRRAPGRAVERPARPESPRDHVQDQPSRARCGSPRRRKRGRRSPLRLRLVVQRLRRRATASSSTRPRRRNPQTAYARVQGAGRARRAARWPTRTFCVVFLRNATAYGASPRMRFDIVLNDLCALAWTHRARSR